MVSEIHRWKTKGVSEIFKTTSKTRQKRSPRFFYTTSKTRHKESLIFCQTDYFKNKSDKRSPRFFKNVFQKKGPWSSLKLGTSKTRYKRHPKIFLNYFKNKRWYPKRSPTIFEATSKTKEFQEIFLGTRSPRDSFELLQKQKKNPRNSFKLLQKQKGKWFSRFFQNFFKNKTSGVPEILSNYFKN